MISIVIPTLNEEKFLPKLLDSLVDQTNKDFETVVVDGSSEDKTVDVARSYQLKLPKLSIIVSKKASLPLQRNLGAKATSGEWLIFIDADSILSPYFIERIYQYISQKNVSLFTTWFRPDSEKDGEAMITLLGMMTLQMSIILHRPITPGPLTGVKRSIFDMVGGYDESHAFNEDVDLGIRLHKAHIPLSVITETLYTWSLRRMRNQGTLKVLQQYVISAFPILLFQRPMKYMPGYVMGGHLYDKKKKPIGRSMLKTYEAKFKNLMRELFE
jgi:glycosyltransferase involved in cell wall biosynthesis